MHPRSLARGIPRDLLLSQVLSELARHGVQGELLRSVDYNIKSAMTLDEGDDLPQIRRRILDADILILGAPIWLGHPLSICQRVLERLDAFPGETDAAGLARNCAHLATLLKQAQYPGQ